MRQFRKFTLNLLIVCLLVPALARAQRWNVALGVGPGVDLDRLQSPATGTTTVTDSTPVPRTGAAVGKAIKLMQIQSVWWRSVLRIGDQGKGQEGPVGLF